ncbi:MAG: amidohydrolase family protein [Saprospiraceae bacterium]|nr:amidohydrolase family protein [Saprospiraceae bacterium]
MKQSFYSLILLFLVNQVYCQQHKTVYSSYTNSFLKIDQPHIALRYAKVIDGTGRAAQKRQTLLIEDGIITTIGPVSSIDIPAHYAIIDLEDHTLIPGIVGTHNHMRLPNSAMLYTSPKLHLAAGVTTIQTCGTGNAMEELAIAKDIAQGNQPGPHIVNSSPYFTGPTGKPHFIRFTDEKRIRDTISYWVEKGVKWFKAYQHTRPSDLAVIIDQAHRLGAKVCAHLCATTYQEAAALGIDAIEHGFIHSYDHAVDREPGRCSGSRAFRSNLSINSSAVKEVQQVLIDHEVALSSTPSILATQAEMEADPRDLRALAPYHVQAYQARKKRKKEQGEKWYFKPEWLSKSLAYDLQFFKAGGLLTAGPDPGIYNLPGFGDQKNYELFIRGGFTPTEAIQVMTSNGARSLGLNKIGTLAAGMQADLVVLQGDLEEDPSVIRAVEMVFKKGKVYDPKKLLASIQANVGSLHDNSMAYFGQKPPGKKAELFAPGIVSKADRHEFGITFSQAGDECYLGVDEGNRNVTYGFQLVDGVWSQAEALLPDAEGSYHDPMLSIDESRLYYIAHGTRTKKLGKKDANLWYLERTASGWSSPNLLDSTINTPANEFYISFSKSGNLYFASNKQAVIDEPYNYDIYMARPGKEAFDSAIRLPNSVNSNRYDADPFVAADESYIIFGSVRKEGYGHGDLYISFKTETGWTKAQNMGTAVNNDKHQLCPFVSRDGKYLFFTSDQDIYWIDAAIINTLKP